MKAFLTLLTITLISGAIYSLGTLHRKADDQPLVYVADEVALTVDVASPERTEIVRLVQAPGDVEAVLEVDISSEVVGKIEEMPFEEGDRVEKGDMLCRLNDEAFQAAVESGEARTAQLRASIVQAEADLEKSDRDCDRQKDLSERGLTNPLEMEDHLTIQKKARATVEMRRQELVSAEAQLRQFRDDLRRTVIGSPIDGVIAALNAKQGEVVMTGTMNNAGTVIMTVSDLSKMRVRARVDEVDVPMVKADQRARIYLQSDQQRPVPARVVRVASKGTKQPGRDVVTFETVLEVLSHDPRIKPGMSANVEIEVAQRDDTITVPVEAVVHRLRKQLADDIVKRFDERQSNLDISDRARQAQYLKVVYVMEDDVARIRLIEPGIADTKRVEILDGVSVDDVVIIGPYRSLDQLKDGRKVALADIEKKEGTNTATDKDGDGTKSAEGTSAKDKSAKDDDHADSDAAKDDDRTIAAGGSP